ncbi:NAD-dependent succinate-semialdehyde dehydrogenase [Actinomyces sp. F1_1611]
MTETRIVNSPILQEYLRQIAPDRGVFIGGEFRAAEKTFAVTDPATGDVVGQIADGSSADAQAAVEAAEQALVAWRQTSPRERSVILRRAFDLMLEEEEQLTLLISAEHGKALTDARAEVRYAAEFFRWFSEEAVRIEGTYVPAPGGGARTIVTHRPIGVVALITPWNFPAAMATRKLAPALAAGCTALLRPASLTPLTSLAVMHILVRAGVPAGVVNMVPSSHASEISDIWLAAEPVRAVSFTGSTRVGQILMAEAAKRILVSSMELGGNAPFVVAPDADLDAAVEGALVAKLRGGGQACTAANRLYVHADVAEEFTRRYVARISAMPVGPAIDPHTQIGPVISEAAAAEMHGYVDGALAEGARMALQLEVPCGGSFFPPTVLTDVPLDATILQTEVFGPISPIATWTDEEELLAAVNGTEFGLASYVFSQDLQWAMKFAESMEVGMVGINRGLISDPAAPFGGVKQSGIGREGGHEGVHEFLETQYLSVNW